MKISLASDHAGFELKEDIKKLQGDLKEMVYFLGTESKEKIQEGRLKLQAAVKSLKGEAGEKIEEVYENLRVHGQEAVEKGRKKIEERPLTAVCAAFIAGIILDRLFWRK